MLHEFRSPGRDRRMGREVAQARRDAGLSQTELAVRMGMSHSMLSKLEIGARHWTLEALVIATRALDLPPRRLLAGDEHVHVPPAAGRRRATTTGEEHVHVPPAAARRPAAPSSGPLELDLKELPEVDRRLLSALHGLMVERTTRLAA
jgi:transcriptional regulator with XRE-family HTH domain